MSSDHAHIPEGPSVYAALRAGCPQLPVYSVLKRTMTSFSHAAEAECASRGKPRLLLGNFQRERFYRQSGQRWRELAGTADFAAVLGDFSVSDPAAVPAELAISPSGTLAQEWMLLWYSPSAAAVISALEVGEPPASPDVERQFECVWSTEPRAVELAAAVAVDAVAVAAPELAGRARAGLPGPLPSGPDQLHLAAALVSRLAGELALS